MSIGPSSRTRRSPEPTSRHSSASGSRLLVQTAPSRDPSVITDIRGHWAERWITPVARAGLVEAFVEPHVSAAHHRSPRRPGAVRGEDAESDCGRPIRRAPVSGLVRAADSQTCRQGILPTPPCRRRWPRASCRWRRTVRSDRRKSVTGAEAIAAITRLRALGRFPAGASDRP